MVCLLINDAFTFPSCRTLTVLVKTYFYLLILINLFRDEQCKSGQDGGGTCCQMTVISQN